MTDRGPKLQRALEALDRHGVDFMLIGALAGIVHGSAYLTYDVDVVYRRDPSNLKRMATALRDLGVTLRGTPPDLPFQVDERTLAAGSNFTFDTEFGALDILGEAAGMREYDQMREDAIREELWGVPVHVVSIDDLIRMKRAAGRPKDLNMVAELIAIVDDERTRDQGS